jgi:hypothetical protein
MPRESRQSLCVWRVAIRRSPSVCRVLLARHQADRPSSDDSRSGLPHPRAASGSPPFPAPKPVVAPYAIACRGVSVRYLVFDTAGARLDCQNGTELPKNVRGSRNAEPL